LCDPRRLDEKETLLKNEEITVFTKENVNTCYLQTATATIRNCDSSEAKLRLIYDDGNQTTFIKDYVAREINLKVIYHHRISIKTFGTTTASPARDYRQVTLKIKRIVSDEVTEISAVEVPEICFDSIKPPAIRLPVITEL